jgi:hypothetical protein
VKEALVRLAQRIRDEMPELERLIHRAQVGWRHLQESGDDLYLDSIALNLHGFYGGLERLFGARQSRAHLRPSTRGTADLRQLP